MKRRWWMLGLFAPQVVGQVRQDTLTTRDPVTWPKRGVGPKPANGECPVCGTMAPPYKPEVIGKTANSITLKGSLSIRTECAHCNVVFKQDAE